MASRNNRVVFRFYLTTVTDESPILQHHLEPTMPSAKSVLDRMIAAMNRDSDAAKNIVLKAKDVEVFAKPRPKRTRVVKKSPLPLRKTISSKARKTPRKNKAKK